MLRTKTSRESAHRASVSPRHGAPRTAVAVVHRHGVARAGGTARLWLNTWLLLRLAATGVGRRMMCAAGAPGPDQRQPALGLSPRRGAAPAAGRVVLGARPRYGAAPAGYAGGANARVASSRSSAAVCRVAAIRSTGPAQCSPNWF